MDAWVSLSLVFMSGFALGVIVYGLRLRARLRLYRKFIEERLCTINPPAGRSELKIIQ